MLWGFSVGDMWFCGRLEREVSVMSKDIVCEVLLCQCFMGLQGEVVSVWQGLGVRGYYEVEVSMMS